MSMAKFVSSALLLTASLQALPVNNPLDICLLQAESWCEIPCDDCSIIAPFYVNFMQFIDVRVGFAGDYVFDRHLEGDSLDVTKDIDQSMIMTNAGFIAFDVLDWLTVFSRLGATSIAFESNASSFNQQGDSRNGQRLNLYTGTNFSWAVGLQALVWRWGNLNLDLEGQYFRTSQKVTRVLFEENVSNYFDTLYMRYNEWQGSIGAAYQLNPMVIPFAALEYSYVHTEGGNYKMQYSGRSLTEFTNLLDLTNKNPWAYVIGASIVFMDSVNVTIEGRFAGEKAAYVNGQLLF